MFVGWPVSSGYPVAKSITPHFSRNVAPPVMMPPHYFFFLGFIGIDVTGTAPLQKGAIPPTAKRQEIVRVVFSTFNFSWVSGLVS